MPGGITGCVRLHHDFTKIVDWGVDLQVMGFDVWNLGFLGLGLRI